MNNLIAQVSVCLSGRVRAGAEESMFARLSVRRAVLGAVDMLSPRPHHPQRVLTVLGSDG